MERRASVAQTPLKVFQVQTPLKVSQVQRRSSKKSYRRSWRSCGGEVTSHLGYTLGQGTNLRIPTSRRTPKARDITRHVDPEQVALLVKKEWHLSYVTPLYQFRHTQLKSYSRQLGAFMVSEKEQGLAVEVGLESGFKVNFSLVSGLSEADEDAQTVFIQIHSKPMFAAADAAPKVVWSGWLTCVNGDRDYLLSLPSDFVCLPLFCSSGAERLTQLVKAWFRRTFDCNFGPLGINSTNLQWLATLWTGCHPTDNIQYLRLVWTLPTQPPMDVSYSVHAQDAWELWSSVRQEESANDSVAIEEVVCFVRGLQSHFFRHFRIDLSAATLKRVDTTLGSAQHGGKIKISSSNYITTILMLLTECALLKMPC